MLKAALNYAEIGWKILPIAPKAKVPLCSRGVHDATTDKATIKAWFERWPAANIAVACGKESGIYVVDVDFDMDKNVDGWESLKEFPELPRTVRQDSPRGGAHFFFKTQEPPRNKNSFRNGIDVRGENYYIILAPSIHPNGIAYNWTVGHGPDDIEIAEYPDYMRPIKEAPAPMPWDAKKSVAAAPAKPVDSSLLERASSYLAECEPATQGQAGHDKLLWAASALVNGFDLSDSDALSLLWAEFNPRCNPPWDKSSGADVKDFERKVTEARKSCTKPRGWLITEYQTKDDALQAFGEKLCKDLLNAEERKIATPQIIVKSELVKASAKLGAWPEWMFAPKGYVGEMATWINDTAGCQQPKLSLLAALVGAGTLFGGKIKDISDGRTNIYAMGIAPSSAGKDHPMKCVYRLFNAASPAAMNLISGKVTSDSAIEIALVQSNTKLFSIDEVGDYFAVIKNAGNSSGSSYLQTIKSTFKELWSCANSPYKGKQKVEGEARMFDSPHVCLWGLTTPGRLYQGIDASDLEDGFLPRMITAISNERPSYKITKAIPPPQSLIEITKGWLDKKREDPNAGDITNAMNPPALLVETNNEAWKIFEEFKTEQESILRSGDKNRDKITPIWGKALENARRVALIVSAGELFDNPIIMGHHAEFGVKLIRHTISEFIDSINSNMSENEYDRTKKRILAFIIAAGRTGICKRELTRKTQFIKDPKIRDSYIQDMIDGDIINKGVNPKKPKSNWLWQHPFGLIQEEK
jgi:hypothetical protein